MGLTREEILAVLRYRKPQRLEVPEWGGDVFIRVLSAKDQVELANDGEAGTMPVRVILHCLVNEDGDRLFTDEDADALGEEEFPTIMRVFAAVAKLNGLSNAELEEAVEHFARTPDEQRSSD